MNYCYTDRLGGNRSQHLQSLSVLLSVDDLPEKNKLVLEKLNRENTGLYSREKELIKQRDDISANLLI